MRFKRETQGLRHVTTSISDVPAAQMYAKADSLDNTLLCTCDAYDLFWRAIRMVPK